MNKESISTLQMASLLLISLTGSSIINSPQPMINIAQNGAWVSLLFASIIGLTGLACILYLNRQYPGLTFIDWMRRTIGQRMTLVIAVLFLSMPLILLPNMVRDIRGFFNQTMMMQTPPYVFDILVLMSAALTARAGIEVMARMFTLLIAMMYFFIIAVLILVGPYYHPEFLVPVISKGIKPVLHGAYSAVGFPYADVVFLSMLLPYLRKEKDKRLWLYTYMVMVIHTLGLIVVSLCTIMALGPMAGDLKYSLFQIARLINIENIIERIESVIGIALIVGSFMKITIVLFSLNLGVSQLLKLQDNRILLFPIALIVLLLSLTMFSTEAEFRENVSVVRPLMSFIVAFLPLVFIALLAFFKNKLR